MPRNDAKNDPPASLPTPIIPDELATRLNVVQGQMRVRIEDGRQSAGSMRACLIDWARELRDIELRLRSIPVVDATQKTLDEYYRDAERGRAKLLGKRDIDVLFPRTAADVDEVAKTITNSRYTKREWSEAEIERLIKRYK